MATYFNSTMVRLKAYSRIGEIEDKVFQFHYGTIKSIGAKDKSTFVS